MAATLEVVDVTVQALVLTGFGINCDAETENALRRAGAKAERIHLNDLIARPELLDSRHIMAIPGGFSFGDDVASGKILANRLRYRLGGPIKRFIADGKLVIGICNGFQVMVKMGILPLFDGEFVQETTLTNNDSGRFENRWVHLKTDPQTRCVWLRGIAGLELPIRHGEGKFIPRDATVLERLASSGMIALRYCTAAGEPSKGAFPSNPNGAIDDIAGICDPSGRIFGLMPHPEAYVERTNHPRWTREVLPEEGAGLQVFRNAVEYASAHLAISA
ncbi:MAG: phosphoribosylformylglycinamidine synthase subunit PurQ [Candidatus Hydrogenedentes bacterium]|nr:phosphoribosylformylglycinamidine synthase subunit PurQ [Candidatus Hydrogenedentota bacterium]